MSLQNTTNPNPIIIIGLASGLPNPASIAAGDFFYATDTDTLYICNIATSGSRFWGIAGAGITNAAVDIFVNPTTGVDTNPGTLALPVLTLKQAMVLATVNRSTVSTTIHLAAGTYTQPADLVLDVPFPLPGALPLRIVGALTSLGTFTATGGTTGAISPLAAGTITGAFVNHAFKKAFGTFLAGSANPGARFPISDNSVGTVTANTIFSSVPLNNDQFSVATNGAIVAVTDSLTFVGGPLLLDSIQFNVPSGTVLHKGVGLTYSNQYAQENGCYYLGGAGGVPNIQLAVVHVSGASNWAAAAVQPPCGCIYDGSGTTPAMGVLGGLRSTMSNFLGDTIAVSVGGRTIPGIQSIGFLNLHQLVGASCASASDGGNYFAFEGIYTGMVAGTGITGIGPGCIAARNGSTIDLLFCDFEGSGGGGVPLISCDQSKAALSNVTGTNTAASVVLSLLSASSASVTGITCTDASAASKAQVGGNAATTTISGAVAPTTDLAAAAPQLCLVGAPT